MASTVGETEPSSDVIVIDDSDEENGFGKVARRIPGRNSSQGSGDLIDDANDDDISEESETLASRRVEPRHSQTSQGSSSPVAVKKGRKKSPVAQLDILSAFSKRENVDKSSRPGGRAASQRTRRVARSLEKKLPQTRRKSRREATLRTDRPLDGTGTLWTEKYSPSTDSKELCVAPKKVQEVREWLTDSWRLRLSPPTSEARDGPSRKLLVLAGSPGVGKSTMIRVLASEMGWTIHEWGGEQPQFSSNSFSSALDRACFLPYQSNMASFEEFLGTSGEGFQSLEGLSEVQTKVGKSSKRQRTKGPKTNDDAMPTGALLLIDEKPNLHSAEAEMQFRTILSDHVRQSLLPTVLIYSDASEGNHNPQDLERLIDPTLLDTPAVSVMSIRPVTVSKMKKILHEIARKERIRPMNDDEVAGVHFSSGGDLRNAIISMQFYYSGKVPVRKRLSAKSEDKERLKSVGRDTSLSTFHTLGKLLYAKRLKTKSDTSGLASSVEETAVLPLHLQDKRPPLEFVPEDVLERCDMSLSATVAFLSSNCPDFFTEDEDLSRALSHLSDAATLLDRSFGERRDQYEGVFPNGYVASIAGRAVADANRRPAPFRFRQFSAPRFFDVRKKSRANATQMRRLRHKLSGEDKELHLLQTGAAIGSTEDFVLHFLPFVRVLAPNVVETTLSGLHSYTRPAQVQDLGVHEEALLGHQHNEVLQEDDIIDDSSFADDDGSG